MNFHVINPLKLSLIHFYELDGGERRKGRKGNVLNKFTLIYLFFLALTHRGGGKGRVVSDYRVEPMTLTPLDALFVET